jgi:hypothetical protein
MKEEKERRKSKNAEALISERKHRDLKWKD